MNAKVDSELLRAHRGSLQPSPCWSRLVTNIATAWRGEMQRQSRSKKYLLPAWHDLRAGPKTNAKVYGTAMCSHRAGEHQWAG